MGLNRHWATVLRLLALFVVSTKLGAETLVVPDWRPWASADTTQTLRGVLVDVSTVLFKDVAQPPQLQYLPGERMVRTLKEQQADWYYYVCDADLPQQHKLGELLVLHMVVVVKQDSPLKKEADIRKQRLSRPRISLAHLLTVEQPGNNEIDFVDGDKESVRMLALGRVQGALMPLEVFTWQVRQQTVSAPAFRAIPLADGYLPICFFARQTVAEARRHSVAQALGRLARSAQLAALVEPYFGRIEGTTQR